MRVLTHALVLLSCAIVGRAQLVVQPPMREQTLKHLLKVGEKHVEVNLTIQEPKLCDATVKSYSGYFETSASSDRKLFFWLFESRSAPSSDPLVMWLTGGPGCSSMLATLAENGPCTVSKDGKSTVNNPSSWNSKANVIWVDNPAGTGFSVGSNQGHMFESIVADQMYGFLQAFFQHFTQYQNLDFFVTGESYAGHYVPSVSHRIWQGNQQKEGLQIHLKGLAVGNGLTDPLEQYRWYPEMAHTGGKSEGGTGPGVVSDTVYQQMQEQVQPCIDKIAKCKDNTTYEACVEAQGSCNQAMIGPYQQTGMNVYDQRIKCETPPLCYDFSGVTTWLNSPDVQAQLGVNKKWASCDFAINAQFQGDWMQRYDTKLVDLLASGVRVLIYAGDCDFICNWLGNKHWTLKLDWPHSAEFNAAADEPFNVNGKEAGRLRTANGFSFLQVYQAGHMVPMDQPELAVQMLNQFITDKLDASPEFVV
jgi:cathepsin A (carboxypeptidase C)